VPASVRVAVGRPTLHGGPVVLRPVRATPCVISYCWYSVTSLQIIRDDDDDDDDDDVADVVYADADTFTIRDNGTVKPERDIILYVRVTSLSPET